MKELGKNFNVLSPSCLRAAPAPGTAAVWRYRAIYLQGDQVFGQWSDVVSLAVTG